MTEVVGADACGRADPVQWISGAGAGRGGAGRGSSHMLERMKIMKKEPKMGRREQARAARMLRTASMRRKARTTRRSGIGG